MSILHQYGNFICIGVGKHLIITNTVTGNVDNVKLPNLPKSIPDEEQQQEGTIEAITTTADHAIMIVSNNLKQLVAFSTSDFKVLQNLTVNKAAVKICVDNERNLIIADKTGDVYLCKSNEKPKLILGHLSIILDMVLSVDNKFLITCDRDEKIRVSHYPNCYNIVCYCLGHTEFVTNIAFCQDHLVSASGDGTLRMWDYKIGKELQCFDTNVRLSDPNILHCFRDEMNRANIEVAAIPISNMQLYQLPNFTSIIALQLCTINKIEIYEFCSKQTLKHLQTIDNFTSDIVNIHLNEVLVIITKNELLIYDYWTTENKFVRRTQIINMFEKFDSVLKQKLLFQNQRDVTLLYKRKYDNVQEYLERKKQRIKLK